MAIVTLKNVKVVSEFSRGFRVVDESTGKDGKTYSQRWTVWADGLGLTVGEVVSLSGLLSAKVAEWSDDHGQVRRSVELSLNSPRLATGDGVSASEVSNVAEVIPAIPVPATGGWAATTYPADVPF